MSICTMKGKKHYFDVRRARLKQLKRLVRPEGDTQRRRQVPLPAEAPEVPPPMKKKKKEENTKKKRGRPPGSKTKKKAPLALRIKPPLASGIPDLEILKGDSTPETEIPTQTKSTDAYSGVGFEVQPVSTLPTQTQGAKVAKTHTTHMKLPKPSSTTQRLIEFLEAKKHTHTDTHKDTQNPNVGSGISHTQIPQTISPSVKPTISPSAIPTISPSVKPIPLQTISSSAYRNLGLSFQSSLHSSASPGTSHTQVLQPGTSTLANPTPSTSQPTYHTQKLYKYNPQLPGPSSTQSSAYTDLGSSPSAPLSSQSLPYVPQHLRVEETINPGAEMLSRFTAGTMLEGQTSTHTPTSPSTHTPTRPSTQTPTSAHGTTHTPTRAQAQENTNFDETMKLLRQLLPDT